MRTDHATFLSWAAVTAATVLSMAAPAGSQTPTSTPHHPMAMTGTAVMTKTEKIANATSAAPASIAGKAAVLDWPATEGDQPVKLRPGTNGWSCLPDMPDTQGNDPMCLDAAWIKWVEAYLAKKAPNVGRVGVGYMVAAGGGWGSNTDPYAMKQTADNHWGLHRPHLMIVVPDVGSLAGMSIDPDNGGPYVMYAGTPYAHIMAPILPATAGGQ